MRALSPLWYEQDEAKRVELVHKITTGALREWFQRFDKLLRINGTGFYAGTTLSVADFHVCAMRPASPHS
jgi:hypothetical protein